jgi:heparanase 1
VSNCAPPPPPAPWTQLNVSLSVGGAPAGAVPLHPLAPAVALDFWLPTDPRFGEKWGNSGLLSIDLGSEPLRAYARALAPALLRLGGSPEDSIQFDADGSCVPGGGAGPFPGYFCSQVSPYVYGCLSRARWAAVLEFAAATGLRIAFGVNGCWGRANKSAPMDFSNVRALMEATAADPNAAVLAYWELSNEVRGGGRRGS